MCILPFYTRLLNLNFFFFLPHILHSCFIPFGQECIAGGGAGLCVVVGFRKWAGQMGIVREDSLYGGITHCDKCELLKYMYFVLSFSCANIEVRTVYMYLVIDYRH